VTDSSLPVPAQALVKIRASQINGCAPCTNAHTKDAAHAGESPVQLNLVAVWREATVFTDAQKAARNSPSKASASPTQPVASPTRHGERRQALPAEFERGHAQDSWGASGCGLAVVEVDERERLDTH
jgi:AhpD family alkylhydroperoxidase